MNTLPEPLATARIPDPVVAVLTTLQANGFQALLVGGCVRDLLRGVPPKDHDVATSARPEEVQRAFKKVIPTGIKFGTVTVLQKGIPVEVTTFRTEGEYLDGRRPETVVFKDDVADDLSRRDFTINAMAFDPLQPRLVDPFGGQRDLAAKLIRCVGKAQDRFGEDGLRSLRAVRFAAVLGFELVPETRAAIAGTLEVFKKIARERIREELTKLLLSARPRLGLELLRDTGLLATFLPEALTADFDARAAAVEACSSELELRLAALVPAATAREALLRLTYATKVAERAALLGAQPLPLDPTRTDAELRRYAAALGPDQVASAITLAAAQHGADTVAPAAARLRALLSTRPPLSSRDLALDGKAIMAALNVPPGRVVGDATRYLLEQVLDQPALNTAEALTDLLQRWTHR